MSFSFMSRTPITKGVVALAEKVLALVTPSDEAQLGRIRYTLQSSHHLI